jgi:hypothetical protein
MASESILEPNYAVLRARFAAEARLQVDTILTVLLPEGLIESEHKPSAIRCQARRLTGRGRQVPGHHSVHLLDQYLASRLSGE